MADKLEHLRAFLSQTFESYIIEIFLNYCNDEEYEEANIKEDIEEPKDSSIYDHMQSVLQWDDTQTNQFIQALHSAIHPQIEPQPQTDTDTDSDDMDEIYGYSEHPNTVVKPQQHSKEFQSILNVLSMSYKADIVDIFSRFCTEQEYLETSNIKEDISEDNDSIILEHMQSQCHWNKSQSQAFIKTLSDIVNGEKKVSKPLVVQPIAHTSPSMAYRSTIHQQFGLHRLLEELFGIAIPPINRTPSHMITQPTYKYHYSVNNPHGALAIKPPSQPPSLPNLKSNCNETKTNTTAIKDYTNVDVETRARISLRKALRQKYQNQQLQLDQHRPVQPLFVSSSNVIPLLHDVHNFEDDDDWNTVTTNDLIHNTHNKYDNLMPNITKNVDDMVGLLNIGATCHMNAVLQALNCSDMYRDFLLDQVKELKYDAKYAAKYKIQNQSVTELHNQYTRQQKATIELKNLMRSLHDKDKRAVSTRALVRSLPKRWRPGKQQDSNEFAKFVLNYVWETIDQSSIMKNIYDKTGFDWTEIHQLKQLRLDPYSHGMLNYTTKCLQCNSKSAKFEAFFDLALALSNHKEDKVSTKKLIEEHMKEEQLTKDNAYFCNKCMRNVEAVRFISIVRPPKLLLICFKRYQVNIHTQSREKIMTNVDCPLLLQIERDIYDLQNHEKVPYILYAVVVHHGLNAQFGHYYTIGRHSDDALKCYTSNSLGDGNWYRFDDSRVSKSSYEQLNALPMHDTPYMLFYLRVEDN
eukprot:169273_1